MAISPALLQVGPIRYHCDPSPCPHQQSIRKTIMTLTVRYWRAVGLLLLCIPCFAAGQGHAHDSQQPIGDAIKSVPIFDAHVHYKRPAWGPFPPATVIELMDKSGVAMALVSSTAGRRHDPTVGICAPGGSCRNSAPLSRQRPVLSNWTKGAWHACLPARAAREVSA